MNFTEVVAEVVSITKRPDKIADIRREVNKAINFCCLETNFANDFFEQELAVDSNSYNLTIDLLNDLTRFRKFIYIRPVDRTAMLCHINPAQAFKGGKERKDSYYVASSTAVIRLSAPTSSLIIGYMQYPPVLTDDSPDFWLLAISPYMVIDLAAAMVFKNIGNNEEYTTHYQQFTAAYASACRDYRLGQNYGV